MRTQQSKFIMNFSSSWGREIQKSKNPKRKILRRKSKGHFIREKRFHNKRKSFIKSPYKFCKRQRIVTLVLRHSTSSFGNKLLLALDWSSKSRKRHRRSSHCGQSERIRGKIFFCKEYYIWDCTHNIFNFNKYLVRIIFVIVLLTSQDHLRNLCVQS